MNGEGIVNRTDGRGGGRVEGGKKKKKKRSHDYCSLYVLFILFVPLALN